MLQSRDTLRCREDECSKSVQSLRTSDRPEDWKATPPITTSRFSVVGGTVGFGGGCRGGMLAVLEGLLGGL